MLNYSGILCVQMPRHELLRCFMKEYGDCWTLGFACEAFVVIFINCATPPISSVPEPLSSACIAAATAEAAFCFMCTSLNKKAYAVMNAMSEAQVRPPSHRAHLLAVSNNCMK